MCVWGRFAQGKTGPESWQGARHPCAGDRPDTWGLVFQSPPGTLRAAHTRPVLQTGTVESRPGASSGEKDVAGHFAPQLATPTGLR